MHDKVTLPQKSGYGYWTGGILILLLFYLFDRGYFLDYPNFIAQIFAYITNFFHSIGNYEENNLVYVPFALTLCLTVIGIMIFPKPPRPLVITITLALAASHTLYVLFRIFCTVNLKNPLSAFSTLLLLSFDLVVYAASIMIYLQILFTTNRVPYADRYEKDVLNGSFTPLVDVFIPTHSEPVDMLRRTIIGCQCIDYKNKTIYLLDDGRRQEIENLAQELGCQYIARAENSHAKAGNINHALKKTHGEFIAMFDADCVPKQNFLSRMIGFFQEKDLGLIISAQTFYNAEMFSHNIMSLMEMSTFFRMTQKGRDRFNALLCFGTCFIVRRKAMEHIQGMPTETLSEDWATSIKLQAHGFRTYMLDEILGSSAVAESMGEFVQQRIRWTQGTLQALFASTNPLTIRGLKPIQRLIHAYGILHYLITPFYIFVIFIPLLYFFFGLVPFYVSRGQFWFFFMPYALLNITVFSWLTQEYTSKLSGLICESFLCIPITITILKTLLRPFGWRFRVTKKGVYRTKTSLNWIIGGPLLIFLSAVILGTVYGYFNRHWYDSTDLFYFLFLFSIFRVPLLTIALYAAHDFPQQRKTARFAREYPCTLKNNEMTIATKTIDISETGVLIKGEPSFMDKVSQNTSGKFEAVIDIPDVGLHKIPARFVRASKTAIALTFQTITIETYRQLIKHLYCQTEHIGFKESLDKKVLKSIWQALRFKNLFSVGHVSSSKSPIA